MDKTKKWTLLFISLSLVVVLFIGFNRQPEQPTTHQSKEESLVENHQQDSLIIETEQEASSQKEESINKKENKEEKKKKPQKESVHKKEEVKPTPSKPSKPKPSKPKPVEPQRKEIAVTLSIMGHNKNGPASILRSTTVYAYKGDTVFDVLKKASKQHGFALKTKGFGPTVYVSGINGLNEFDYGQESGWMYKVNGTRPLVGCGSYELESNDHIEWYYVTEYVRD